MNSNEITEHMKSTSIETYYTNDYFRASIITPDGNRVTVFREDIDEAVEALILELQKDYIK